MYTVIANVLYVNCSMNVIISIVTAMRIPTLLVDQAACFILVCTHGPLAGGYLIM